MFECEFCEVQFLTEEKFSVHACEQKNRMMELDSVRGVKAFNYYNKWFKVRGYHPQLKTTFISSRYYNSFFRFIDFIEDKGIPDTDLYIKFMSEDEIMPLHWDNDSMYDHFITKFDRNCPATTHLRITLLTLEKIGKIFECKIDQIFDNMKTNDLIKMISSRNLSPWVLLLSVKFMALLAKLDAADRELIEKFIDIPHWKRILKDNESSIPLIRGSIEQLGL